MYLRRILTTITSAINNPLSRVGSSLVPGHVFTYPFRFLSIIVSNGFLKLDCFSDSFIMFLVNLYSTLFSSIIICKLKCEFNYQKFLNPNDNIYVITIDML